MMNNEVVLPDGSSFLSDGCTGFPDTVGGHEFTHCCVLHDGGATDGQLLDCLTAVAPGYGWGIVIVACVAVMMILRPVYETYLRFKHWREGTK